MTQASSHPNVAVNASTPLNQQQQQYFSQVPHMGNPNAMTAPQSQQPSQPSGQSSHYRPFVYDQHVGTNATASTSSYTGDMAGSSTTSPPAARQYGGLPQPNIPINQPLTQSQAERTPVTQAEINRAKVTYSSRASSSQQPPQKISPERQIVLESIMRDVYAAMKVKKLSLPQ